MFDFDGTLADTFSVAVGLLPRLARELRFRDPGPEGIASLRGLPARRILSELGVAPWKVPLLLWRARALLRMESGRITLFAGIADLLVELDERGVAWGIATTNSRGLVQEILRRGGAPEPGWLEAGLSLAAKPRRIRSLAARLGFAPSDLAVVGDEIRDVEAARACGAVPLGVAWGYNGPEALLGAGATCVLADVRGLREVLLGERPPCASAAGIAPFAPL